MEERKSEKWESNSNLGNRNLSLSLFSWVSPFEIAEVMRYL